MAQKKPKQGAEYVLSPHLGLLMPVTNSVKAGKNAYKKPKTDSSILGSIYGLHRTQLRLEKLCIQLCHQECYFVHDGFLLSLCCSNFTTYFCACQRFFENC